jgi:hypothetical protein
MLRYAVRNVLHYRTKYAIAFVLIAAFSACLALSLFAFNGFWKQAAAYARSWGDISLSVDPASLDSGWRPKAGSDAEPPSRRLEREAVAFIKDSLKAERVVATGFIGGDVYAPAGSWGLSATILERARQLAPVDLAEGSYPGEGELLLPTSVRPSLKVGDAVTFVYKNSDLIINSLRFRVSGFFLPTSNSAWQMYASQAQFDRLDPGRASEHYFAFLPAGDRKGAFLGPQEAEKAYQSFRTFLFKLSRSGLDPKGGFVAPPDIKSGYFTARQRYGDSKTLIEFFEIIISIFLIALVIVAMATIINVLFITVVDRIKIIGTFMAFGMTRRRAILLLSSEMLLFSLAACTVGVLAAFAIIGPVSSLRFTADNWTIAVILGGKRGLTIVPALWAVGATYLAGMLLPFATAALSTARMLKGEVVGLLHYAK